jgi:hypothetical protein
LQVVGVNLSIFKLVEKPLLQGLFFVDLPFMAG